jgi:tetratricopeptide (TPR) repeat protein/CHAT domain-containing protein
MQLGTAPLLEQLRIFHSRNVEVTGAFLPSLLVRRHLWARRSILCPRAIANALIIASNIFSVRALAPAGFALLMAMTAGVGSARAPDDDLDSLNQQVVELYQAGKYAEATPIADRVLALAERRFGPDHPQVGTRLNDLALLYRAQGRYADAEPLYKRVLGMVEKAFGRDHLEVSATLISLGIIYQAQGRYADAELQLKRALAIRERGLGQRHPDVANVLTYLAVVYQAQARDADAEAVTMRTLAIQEAALGMAHPDVASTLNNLALIHSRQGRYAEAESLHKRSLAIREAASGRNHSDLAPALANLGALYYVQGRYADAEPLMRRALSIDETALGAEHPDVSASLNNLAELYRAQSRYADAEPLYKRALFLLEKAFGPNHPNVAASLGNLAELYRAQGRFGAAELLAKRALAVSEAVFGTEHPGVGPVLISLARTYDAQGRYADAEPLMRRALSIYETALGAEHPDASASLNSLAELYRAQARYADAEPLYKRALFRLEKAFGPNHPNVAASLGNLAELYRAQGRYGDAELLAKRALAVRETIFGPGHPAVSEALVTLAVAYGAQGRYADAEPLMRRALANYETALGAEHPSVASMLNDLGLLYRAQNRDADAEPLMQRALAIFQKALQPDQIAIGVALNNLAELYRAQDRYEQAEPLYKRALSIFEMALGPDHPDVASILNNVAALHFAQESWGKAVAFLRRGSGVTVGRVRRGADAIGRVPTGKALSEAARDSLAFSILIKAAHRLAGASNANASELAREMFRTAQWGLGTEASASLAQMAARQAKGDGTLAHLVRERQDLVGEWQAKDKLLVAARAEAPAHRNVGTEAELNQRLAAIDTRIADIDRALAKDFSEYTALAAPEPLSVVEAQAHLQADEALVLLLVTPEWKPTPEETFIWVVTKTDMRWARAGLGTKALGEEVQALRCGLDHSAWTGSRCLDLTRQTFTEEYSSAGKALPFDLSRAHKLDRALFGEIADLIAGKHLLVVPSGPLTQMQFHVLVSEAPNPALTGVQAMREAKWLVRSHALTVLPAVSSLKALRRDAQASRAAKPYLGVGNPLLDGPDGRYANLAKQARAKQSCVRTGPPKVASFSNARGGVGQIIKRSGLVDLAHIRVQTPLPETADELCAVARNLKVGVEDVRLGARAGEADLKGLSEQGALANYRVLHFATHGALSGEITGGNEPGLILNPPGTATERDDGYLSASEIAGLKLDADWVILSACNTAAGGADNAEALSGLARAFFYSGARALLVSHWAVYSDATVKLVTKALSTMAADPSVGRAEALRRSMLAMIDKGEPQEAHPAYWAPFVVVGEGAAAR